MERFRIFWVRKIQIVVGHFDSGYWSFVSVGYPIQRESKQRD